MQRKDSDEDQEANRFSGIVFGLVPRGDSGRRTVGTALTHILGDFGGSVLGVGYFRRAAAVVLSFIALAVPAQLRTSFSEAADRVRR